VFVDELDAIVPDFWAFAPSAGGWMIVYTDTGRIDATGTTVRPLRNAFGSNLHIAAPGGAPVIALQYFLDHDGSFFNLTGVSVVESP
jgi:hypothetical protein